MIVLFCLANGVNNRSVSECPKDCNCSSNSSNRTIGCLECLQNFFRVYSSSDNNCPCTSGFRELEVAGYYCCPMNCTICSSTGDCVQCGSSWTLQKSDVGLEVCMCRQNFYYDGTDCYCLSQIQPTGYYWVEPENSCYVCPSGCNCTVDGCISCSTSARRVVIIIQVNLTHSAKSCPCLPPFEPTDVGCACPTNCNCTHGSISCDDTSQRFLTAYNIWLCKAPFYEVNGTCVCRAPYVLDDISLGCICSSRFNTSLAYLSK